MHYYFVFNVSFVVKAVRSVAKCSSNYMQTFYFCSISSLVLLIAHLLMCTFRAHVILLLFSGCVTSNGAEYRGEQDSSSSGLICLNWTNTTRDYDVNIHPDTQTGKQLHLVDIFMQRLVNVALNEDEIRVMLNTEDSDDVSCH